MKKYIPYILILLGGLIIIRGIAGFLENKEVYRILFSIKTSNQYYYLLFRGIFGGFVIYSGLQQLKAQKSR